MNKSSQKKLQTIEELILPSSKLRFCSDQLQNLNFIFTKSLTHQEDAELSNAISLAKSVTERLIQRLLCGVGLLDSRFSSKFLVALHDTHNFNSSRSLQYLLRLDLLSKPSLYPSDSSPKYSVIENDVENCPSGYARIRIHPSQSKTWSDLINPSGFLRRDKVQTRMVELLALAASGDTPNSPLSVDESVLCGSPGKVVDALTLHNILKKPPQEHVFYGAAGTNPRFPEPKDFKLAIVDEPSGIRLRVGFLSPALSSIVIEVRLLVAIGLDAWPSTTNFPGRISLAHTDCLPYHRAAQTGLYLTGYGVQSSAWQIRLPAAELIFEENHSIHSTIKHIQRTLSAILDSINCSYKNDQITYKILNYYAIRTALLYHLESDLDSPTQVTLNWSPKYFSSHVLRVLDNLTIALRSQRQPNYFFPNANLFVNPGHLCEDDFILESNKIKTYMLKLFDESLTTLKANESFKTFLTSQKIEILLLNKWKDLIDGLVPPSSTRGRRICFAKSKHKPEVVYTQYTVRQLEYIGIILKNMLFVKQITLQDPEEYSWAVNLKIFEFLKENSIEDVIYILVTLIEQAKRQFIKSLPDTPATLKIKGKLKRQFDVSTSKLVELVRNETEAINSDALDDVTLVKIILKWLYRGLDHNKKNLAPALRPYLAHLFVSSHAASWHLETIKQAELTEETEALCAFAKLVNSGTITPGEGLVDSINKNWNWAESVLNIIGEAHLRIIFIPERGKVNKHILSLPKNDVEIEKSIKMLKQNLKNESSTIIQKKFLEKLLYNSMSSVRKNLNQSAVDVKSWHCILRQTSSMTEMFAQVHRRGMHRCCGDIVQTLMAMQNPNILQEISLMLSAEDQKKVTETFQKLSSEKNKKLTCRAKCATLAPSVSFKKGMKIEAGKENKEKYTPHEESAGIKDLINNNDKDEEMKINKKKEEMLLQNFGNEAFRYDDGTLIGSCRSARIREDTSILQFEDSFRIRSLMNRN